MQISINLPHVFSGGANPNDNARALRRFLDLMVGLNLDYLETHPNTPDLYKSGVVYQRTEVWDPIPALYNRGYGDCKSLATAFAAQEIFKGRPCKVVFRFIPKIGGGCDFHILNQLPDRWEDPSKILGMGQHENAPFFAAGSWGQNPMGVESERPKLSFSIRRLFAGVW